MSESELFDAVFKWLDRNGVPDGGTNVVISKMHQAGIINNSNDHRQLVKEAILSWDGWDDEYAYDDVDNFSFNTADSYY